MSTFGKGRCTVCGNLNPLRKNGLIGSHPPLGHCDGTGLLPANPDTEPTWEARALHAEQILERIRTIPVQRGGVISAAALAKAMGE